MTAKKHAPGNDKISAKQQPQQSRVKNFTTLNPQLHPALINQQVNFEPNLLTPRGILQLQRTLGNRVVGKFLGKTSKSQSAQVVQRLMDINTFKDKTKVFGSTRAKSRIHLVDTALLAYTPGGTPNDRINQLQRIWQACKTYLNLPQDAKRKAGVGELQDDVENEIVQIITHELVVSEGIDINADFDTKAKTALEVTHWIDWYNNAVALTGKLATTVQVLQVRVEAVMSALIQKDLSTLQAIEHDVTASPITQNIIHELMANVPNVEFKIGSPGANKLPIGGLKSHRVYHSLEQKGGEPERVGALAHELTHVAVGAKWDNTGLFLSFIQTATNMEIQNLVQARRLALQQLQLLCKNDVVLTEVQKKLIGDKLRYAGENKVELYLARYQEAGKLTNLQVSYIRDKMANANIDNSVIEYDSVLNQILVYLYMWGIPAINPLHAQVLIDGQNAATRRTT